MSFGVIVVNDLPLMVVPFSKLLKSNEVGFVAIIDLFEGLIAFTEKITDKSNTANKEIFCFMFRFFGFS
jgi:predicted methyltransferase